jgi:hypothetical protein
MFWTKTSTRPDEFGNRLDADEDEHVDNGSPQQRTARHHRRLQHCFASDIHCT